MTAFAPFPVIFQRSKRGQVGGERIFSVTAPGQIADWELPFERLGR
jgi:hypothetical protein